MAAAAHQETIPTALIWQNTLYAALYIAVVLLAAAAIFSSRDLK
jgi:ABC-type transport system involved in multi-copper enzyme maturation permease subunit